MKDVANTLLKLRKFQRNQKGESMEDRYLFKGKEKDSGKWLEWNVMEGIPHNVTILTNTIC